MSKNRSACTLALIAVVLLRLAEPAQAQVRAEVYVSGLSSPVAFVQDPSNPNVQYVVEQAGRIRVVSGGALAATDFLNLSSRISVGNERGLLGLAFPPDYCGSGRFYVYFTDTNGNLVVARFKRSANPLVADSASEFDLLWGANRYIPHPTFANHNGGSLAFGPDGYLYIGTGDGGAGDDPPSNAQNPNVLLGKMLRVDVSVADGDNEGYDVPADNPFVGGGPVSALPEIWAFGLRNPWKFSFDNPGRAGSGALLIGDVGQSSWEEFNYEPAGHGGRNYGWRIREGAHDHLASPAAAYTPLKDPVFDYDHSVGFSVIGGYVYRGSALGSAYYGRYFFGDLSGRVWSIALNISGQGEAAPCGSNPTAGAAACNLVEHTAELGGGAIGTISGFGEDSNGELYVVSYAQGRILRISPAATVRLLWQNDTTRQVTSWYLGGAQGNVLQGWNYLSSTGVPGWSIVGSGDFNGDGNRDLVWQNDTTRQVTVWYMSGALFQGFNYLSLAGVPGWTVVGTGDFNGDGKPDLVWQNDTNHQVTVWYFGGAQGNIFQGWNYLVPAGVPGWTVVGTGDFNADGKPDLIWQNPTTRQVTVWYFGGSQGNIFQGWSYLSLAGVPGWTVVGAGFFNGDATSDLVWQNDATRQVSVWYMGGPEGNVFLDWNYLSVSGIAGWRVVAR